MFGFFSLLHRGIGINKPIPCNVWLLPNATRRIVLLRRVKLDEKYRA